MGARVPVPGPHPRPAAWGDAGKLKADAADHRLAAVFVSLRIPVKQVQSVGKHKNQIDKARVREAVESWCEALDLHSDARIGAFAWVFPSKVDKFVSKDGETLYPGTLLILAERKKGNRAKKRVEIGLS